MWNMFKVDFVNDLFQVIFQIFFRVLFVLLTQSKRLVDGIKSFQPEKLSCINFA